MATKEAAKKTVEAVVDIVPVNLDVTPTAVSLKVSKPFIVGVVGGVALTVVGVKAAVVMAQYRARKAHIASGNEDL